VVLRQTVEAADVRQALILELHCSDVSSGQAIVAKTPLVV